MSEPMQKELEKESIIVVKFDQIGSVILETSFQNVTPLQILAVAEFLRIRGEAATIQQEMQQAQAQQMKKIAVPGTMPPLDGMLGGREH